MNKQEFFDRVNCGANFNLLEEDWEDIQLVYNFHPLISDVNGKDELAAFYNQGGMGLIHDMASTAKKIADNESAAQQALVAIEKIKKQFESDKAELQEKMKQLQADHFDALQAQTKLIEKCGEENELIAERYKKS